MAAKQAGTRGSAIERTLLLVKRLLAGDSLDRAEAARVLRVGNAAAARHLQKAARVLGLDVEAGQNRGRVYSMRARRGRQLSDTEVVGFALGAALAPMFRGSAHESGMRRARDEVLRGATARKELNRKFGFVPRGGEMALPERASELDEIIDALLRDEVLDAEYQHFDGRVERLKLHPLTLLVSEHQLYLVAYRNSLSDTHVYRFSRFILVERSGVLFSYPSRATYDPDALFRASFGIFVNEPGPIEHVVIQLRDSWSVYAKSHRWHPSQVVSDTPNGPRVELDVRVCRELVAWVRSFGPDATVISPKSLEREIQRSP